MRLSYVVFVTAAVLCAVGHIAILLSVVRSRAAVAVADPNVPRPRLGTEVFWAIVPALILALVLTATWTRVRDSAAQRPAEIMKVAR
ncbi:MAG: hypothetical protein WD801_06840 [Gemmatimonadaceae bacterium]